MYKQVIIIRSDLEMSIGKRCSQVAHASLEAYKKAKLEVRKKWSQAGARKVVVKVEDLNGLLEIYNKVKKLPCELIRDAGKTQIPKGTITTLGIGPAESKEIDKVTKDLKLL